MAKDKKKSKKGDGLSKAERRELEAREQALVEELAARAEKASKKAKKAGKGREPDLTELKKKALKALIADKTNGKALRKAAKKELESREVPPVTALPPARKNAGDPDEAEPKKGKTAKEPSPREKVKAAAEKVLSEPGTKAAKVAAETALEAATEASDEEDDEQIKARVRAKREAREAEAVAEKERAAKPVKPKKGEAKSANPEKPGSARADDALEGESEVDYQWRKAGENANVEPPTPIGDDVEAAERAAFEKAKSKKRKAKPDELVVEVDGEALAAPQVAEEVETERGRVFAVGETEAEEYAQPSDSSSGPTLEEGRNGYKIIALNEKGEPDFKRDGTPRTVRQFTRVTTYIDNLEDKTNLEKWKLRTLLEGVAINDTTAERGERTDPIVAKVRDLMHVRDMALAKAEKADRKGKLKVGERADLEHAAIKAFKDAVNAIAEDMLELGGVHEKANRGTNLHALTEVYDADGMTPIDAMLEAGDITKTDHASIVAYGEACEKAGLKMLASEVVVVNDEKKYAGRFDRIVMARRPGTQRATKVIADIKTGRIDYGLAKIEQQLAMYADASEYNLETGERSSHGASRAWGILIHLPQGEGTCTIHILDLNRGRRGNALSEQVRAWRAEARKVDLEPDLAAAKASE